MDEKPDPEFKKRAVKVVERIFKIDQKNNYKSIRFIDAVNFTRISKNAELSMKKFKNSTETMDFYNLTVIC